MTVLISVLEKRIWYKENANKHNQSHFAGFFNLNIIKIFKKNYYLQFTNYGKTSSQVTFSQEKMAPQLTFLNLLI